MTGADRQWLMCSLALLVLVGVPWALLIAWLVDSTALAFLLGFPVGPVCDYFGSEWESRL